MSMRNLIARLDEASTSGDVEKVLASTTKAYSRRAYGEKAWKAVADYLVKKYGAEKAVKIMHHKAMRRAHDAADKRDVRGIVAAVDSTVLSWPVKDILSEIGNSVRLSEAKDGGDYGTMMMAIADRVTRKGPKGIYYAFDDLLREASKDRSKRGTLVRILKDIEANGGLTGLRLPTGEQMPNFKTGFMGDGMRRYIEAAQNGDDRVKPTPEEDAASADFERRAKEAFERQKAEDPDKARRVAEIAKAKADWAVLGKKVGLFGK